MPKVYGWQRDNALNDNLFTEISVASPKKDYLGSNPEQISEDLKDVIVRAKIVSYSISTSATWESALEGKSADSNFSMTSAILQAGDIEKALTGEPSKLAGKSLVSLASSIQIWRGEEPLQISLSIEFMAQQNAYQEVELPIQYLYRMKAPLLGDGVLLGAIKEDSKQFGYIPFDINLDFMSKRFNSIYILESINEDVDGIKIDKSGNRIGQVVSLSFKSKRAMIRNNTDIKIK